MGTFLAVLGFLIWGLALVALVCGPLFRVAEGGLGWSVSRWAFAAVTWAAVFTIVICIPIWLGAFKSDSDNAAHCGPGTFYRESSHYQPATKTVAKRWWCEAS